jgi:hypothetical protein
MRRDHIENTSSKYREKGYLFLTLSNNFIRVPKTTDRFLDHQEEDIISSTGFSERGDDWVQKRFKGQILPNDTSRYYFYYYCHSFIVCIVQSKTTDGLKPYKGFYSVLPKFTGFSFSSSVINIAPRSARFVLILLNTQNISIIL